MNSRIGGEINSGLARKVAGRVHQGRQKFSLPWADRKRAGKGPQRARGRPQKHLPSHMTWSQTIPPQIEKNLFVPKNSGLWLFFETEASLANKLATLLGLEGMDSFFLFVFWATPCRKLRAAERSQVLNVRCVCWLWWKGKQCYIWHNFLKSLKTTIWGVVCLFWKSNQINILGRKYFMTEDYALQRPPVYRSE